MDHHKVLLELTTNRNQSEQSFDERLQQIIESALDLLSVENKEEVMNIIQSSHNDNSVRYHYLKFILHVLESLKNSELINSETFMSVNQHRTVKAVIEIAVSIGILPCLFPGIGAGLHKMCPRAKELDFEDITDLQKYERLTLTIRNLSNLYEEVALRSALLPQLGPLLGSLLQLSYVPLMKPTQDPVKEQTKGVSPSKFKMTNELYEKLIRDQSEFREILSRLIEKCPLAVIVKELMVICGIKDAPKWIRKKTQIYLVDAIVQPNGIMAVVDAVVGDTIDLGAHWEKLDTVSRLVATSHYSDPNKYYNLICAQLINLLSSKNVQHSTTIANSCITALYEHNPKVCVEKIMQVVSAPLWIDKSSSVGFSPRSENEVTACIENLTKIFISKDAAFRHPPCILLQEIALPLFHLYMKAQKSITVLQRKTRDLLLNLMKDLKSRDDLFAVFLNHEKKVDDYYGERLLYDFGPTGGLDITGIMDRFDHETAADSLFDLTMNDQSLCFDLFNYLLDSFASLSHDKSQVLRTPEDTLDHMGRQLAAMKLLSQLAATREIQEAQIKNPQPVISFVKSLFNQGMNKEITNRQSYNEEVENIESLYIGLMLIKIILTDHKKINKDWTSFHELAKFLNDLKSHGKIPEQLLELVEELLQIIKNQGKSPRYQDLSVYDSKKDSEFGKAMKDLADPLLPVRAHGLIALTKLLEKKDPETIGKKDLVLCFFQENLKDEDSFVYLSAVNGLCTLASLFPSEVIEILVQEYIDMPHRNINGEIAPETRAKLGEILVKTTRSLGDMCPAYKNILINGFLCGTRDKDDLVRASSLSCLGEICKVMGFRLGHAINEIIYCIGCIINTDKSPECRRAAVLVATLLIRGLGKDTLTDLGSDLVPLYRALKFLRDNDDDQVLRLHAQLALEELDDIVKTLLYSVPKLEKRLFLFP